MPHLGWKVLSLSLHEKDSEICSSMKAKLGQMSVLLPNVLTHCHFLAFREAEKNLPFLFCVRECIQLLSRVMVVALVHLCGTRTS